MLQRAASNAYSWWWASHIRTTQSKWLEITVVEMEDRVKAMLNLIGADGDSFSKKAELYFKSRPELINHVEEMFRSYQALADRYDRISSELHKANHTIATVFPDQVQFSMEEGDSEGFSKAIGGIDLSNFKFPALEGLSVGSGSQSANRGTSPVPKRGAQAHRKVTPNMTKEKAQEEIDKLQKQILALQTEKEFLKTSYDSALGKYLDIEKQVAQLQDEVCNLQDAFSTGVAIEDNEARALMAAQAIMSCEDTLVNLQDQKNKLTEEAEVELRRANEAIEKLKTFKNECGLPHVQMDGHDHHEIELVHALPFEDSDDSALNGSRLDLQEICQRVKEIIESYPELSVAELADKVDRLVEKVISLELATTSQNAQIDRMKTEIDGLHERLHALEQDKVALVVDSSNLADGLRKVEEMLQEVQQIWKSVQNGFENICKQMTEAAHELTEFVETLHAPEQESSDFVDSSRDSKHDTSLEDYSGLTSLSVQNEPSKSLHDTTNETDKHEETLEDQAQKELVPKESEVEGKILLEDYASVLQSYKDTEQKLSEIEKINKDYHLEAMSELKELKSANATKDEEIHSLRRMLRSLRKKMSASIIESIEKAEETSKISSSPTTEETSKISATPSTEDKEIAEIEEYIKQWQINDSLASSVAEEKFRAEIDRVLGENLDFWLRFSTSYHQIRNFQICFDMLKTEMYRLTDEQEDGGNYGFAGSYQVAKLESAVLEKKFRDLNTDLQVWIEKNVLLKGEVENRFSSLCCIQEDISKITTLDKCDEIHFNPFQAAKFQGEVLNMKQENNKVAKELEAGLDHVRGLQVEVGRVLLKLRENLEVSLERSHRAQQNFRNLSTKAGIPLRTFLFGSKTRKSSFFSCMSPGVHK
uniref:NAB domain-containing protein n=1 Tax=Zea mays TaxID=4577 RepID=A0A804QRE8_MAIZE